MCEGSWFSAFQNFDLPSVSSSIALSPGSHHNPACARRQTANLGFTLIELLVVIAIIGLLARLVAPRYLDQVSKSNTKVATVQIGSLEKGLDQYRLDVGTYPSTEFGLAALNTRSQSLEKWAGLYLNKAVPPDPWWARYIYKSPGDHGDFDLLSLGSDGQVDCSGEAVDVRCSAMLGDGPDFCLLPPN